MGRESTHAGGGWACRREAGRATPPRSCSCSEAVLGPRTAAACCAYRPTPRTANMSPRCAPARPPQGAPALHCLKRVSHAANSFVNGSGGRGVVGALDSRRAGAWCFLRTSPFSGRQMVHFISCLNESVRAGPFPLHNSAQSWGSRRPLKVVTGAAQNSQLVRDSTMCATFDVCGDWTNAATLCRPAPGLFYFLQL